MTDLKPEDQDREAMREEILAGMAEIHSLRADLDNAIADRARMEKAAQAVCSEFSQGHPLIVALKATLGASQ